MSHTVLGAGGHSIWELDTYNLAVALMLMLREQNTDDSMTLEMVGCLTLFLSGPWRLVYHPLLSLSHMLF
jgi:hypothetical protein